MLIAEVSKQRVISILPPTAGKAFPSANAQMDSKKKEDNQLKTKIGRYVADNGNANTVTISSKDLGWSVL